MAFRRLRIGLGVVAVCVVVLLTVLVVQRMHTDQFSGDPEDIAGVQAAVPRLVHGDRTVGMLPNVAAELTAAAVHSQKSVDQRERAIREVWVREHVARELKVWNDYLDDEVETKKLYGFDATDPYDDTRFDVTEWLGVKVTGPKAVVDVRGYDMYHYLGTRGWVKGQALHHRFTLWRESPESDRWYLQDELHDVDNEYRATGDLTVGVAD